MEEELIPIRWHIDRTGDPVRFTLICPDEKHPDLRVSVEASDKMTERTAKAFLMQKMYDLGREKGIAPRRLRFKVNGIEE